MSTHLLTLKENLPDIFETSRIFDINLDKELDSMDMDTRTSLVDQSRITIDEFEEGGMSTLIPINHYVDYVTDMFGAVENVPPGGFVPTTAQREVRFSMPEHVGFAIQETSTANRVEAALVSPRL